MGLRHQFMCANGHGRLNRGNHNAHRRRRKPGLGNHGGVSAMKRAVWQVHLRQDQDDGKQRQFEDQ